MTLDTLIQKIRAHRGDNFDYGLVERAYRFAEEAHRGQMRKSGDDYITHPLNVAALLAEWKMDATTIAAALLHDVAEDSPYKAEPSGFRPYKAEPSGFRPYKAEPSGFRPYTRQDLEKNFGSEVAFLVSALTKLKTIHYTDATERRTENLRKMVLALAEDIRAVLIKLADRLHNMETISFLKPETQERISRETLEIYAPIANRLGMGEVKGYLEDLAFPIAFPEEYQTLRNMVAEPLEERRALMERIIPEIRQLLKDEGLEPKDIHSRAKHWYSLWKKLQKYDMNLEAIYDLVAVRIIVATVEQCYAALGAIHGKWAPLPGRIKDYIALPKPNGYRSLHTTVFGPEGKIIEIQIRTREMHEEAEGGIAAHWAYAEEKGRDSKALDTGALQRSRKLEWVNQLREWQAHFADTKEFLESLKIDFFKDRIFVFTPKGEVIDLPEGATPVDFAYHIHSRIGDQAVGAKINGKMSALDSALKNGDIVEILRQKNKKPSRQWLEFVKTSIARKHIQSALKHAGQ